LRAAATGTQSLSSITLPSGLRSRLGVVEPAQLARRLSRRVEARAAVDAGEARQQAPAGAEVVDDAVDCSAELCG
jgi:hypothetical protein